MSDIGLPTGIVPQTYLGLANPVELKPTEITGKSKFITMYSSYQEIDRSTALRILDIAYISNDRRSVKNIMTAITANAIDIREDLDRIFEDTSINSTTRQALVSARLGQGKFRAGLNAAWDSSCAITGCSVSAMLRASHIKPWRSSNNKERLDSENGILLAAHLDALFDAGLITFSEAGDLIASPLLKDDGNPPLSLSVKLKRPPSRQMNQYLEHHRKLVFRDRPGQAV